MVVDRLKDLIKVNAFQVAPAKVEAVLERALGGRRRRRRRPARRPLRENPVAFVVTNADATDRRARHWIGARLAPVKRPVAFHPVDDLPRNSSGKLLRRKLRVPPSPDPDPAARRWKAGCRYESDTVPTPLPAAHSRHVTLRNRVVFGAHTASMAEGGVPGRRHLGYYVSGHGGTAIVVE